MNSQNVVSESTLTETSTASARLSTCALVCPICNQRDWAHAQRIRGAWISKCAHCGLLGTTNSLKGFSTIQGPYETPPEHPAKYRQQHLTARSASYERVIPHLARSRTS